MYRHNGQRKSFDPHLLSAEFLDLDTSSLRSNSMNMRADDSPLLKFLREYKLVVVGEVAWGSHA